MRTTGYKIFLAALLLCTTAGPRAWAWGNTGHEAVAYVAWQQMTPATRARVLQLIALVPERTVGSHVIEGYADWVKDLPAGLTQDQKNLYLFMRAATWSDSIKHAGLTDTDTPPAGRTPPDTNLGFTDKESHGYWHFIDIPYSTDGSTMPKIPSPNVVTQILALRTDLASNEPDLLKAYDLIWIEHLCGDVHQPLHSVVRIAGGKGDEGGNTVYIKLPVPMEHEFEAGSESKTGPGELHAFWDSLPGEGTAKDVALAAAFGSSVGTAPAAMAADSNVAHWAEESLDMAKADVYTADISASTTKSTPVLMTQVYYDTALTDVKARVALAGARLANLLNANLK